ncbi:hypothetical protein CWB90_23760, partial [Pseudoalteromonas piscicida]
MMMLVGMGAPPRGVTVAGTLRPPTPNSRRLAAASISSILIGLCRLDQTDARAWASVENDRVRLGLQLHTLAMLEAVGAGVERQANRVHS